MFELRRCVSANCSLILDDGIIVTTLRGREEVRRKKEGEEGEIHQSGHEDGVHGARGYPGDIAYPVVPGPQAFE